MCRTLRKCTGASGSESTSTLCVVKGLNLKDRSAIESLDWNMKEIQKEEAPVNY